MKIKIAEYMADFFAGHGIKHVFTVTGGGAMHLNDAFGHHKDLKCIYNHHEQASAIAAESYARLTGKPALVCVTSGPGGTNAITGVLGAYLDSIPMAVVSGQVKRETTVWASDLPLRQLGDQEYPIVESVRRMTKYAVMLTDPQMIRYELEKAYFLAMDGRKGPVWIDVPLDIQNAVVETDALPGFTDPGFKTRPINKKLPSRIIEKIRESRRPVILAGEGIRLGDAYEEFLSLVKALKVPVLTSWNANDLLWHDSPFYAGCPGTVGMRGANFAVQSADLLLTLGCRMNIRTISYNRLEFAASAYKIMVDIDDAELYKPTLDIDLPVHADVKELMPLLTEEAERSGAGDHERWLEWCRDINDRYPAVLPEYSREEVPMNPYPFIQILSRQLGKGAVVCCGNGAACVQTFQAFEVKEGQRLYTNSGCASMGYGFPAAVGAAVSGYGNKLVCIDGDGSFMMNLQELQTVVHNKLDIKLIILNNNGYHSIRQTQQNLFKDRPLAGVSADNGVSFPDYEKVAWAFGLPFMRLSSLSGAEGCIGRFLSQEGPCMLEAVLDWRQNFEPKLSSKVLPDGRIVSPPLDDMYPFLDPEEYEAVKKEAAGI